MAYLSKQPIEEAVAASRGSISTDADAFRFAMREFATGVAIVAAGYDERRNGCTATSLCSLSIEPPTLLVCLARASATLSTIGRVGAFGVSLLDDGHSDLADRFAGRVGVSGAARFEAGEWITLSTGAPLLENAIAMIDCKVEEIIERHTHAIVIGSVTATRVAAGRPLLHWRGRSCRY